jgi:hypothetical protein
MKAGVPLQRSYLKHFQPWFLPGLCRGQEDVPRLLCEPGDTPPPNRVDTAQQVVDLRAVMTSNNVAGYIVLTNDEHQVGRL